MENSSALNAMELLGEGLRTGRFRDCLFCRQGCLQFSDSIFEQENFLASNWTARENPTWF